MKGNKVKKRETTLKERQEKIEWKQKERKNKNRKFQRQKRMADK